jgi:nucleoside-diphosphate-sugar epimerase
MNKILVTGATGFIGRSLVEALVRRGDIVRSFDDDSRGSKQLLNKSVECITADIRDLAAVKNACKGMDVVCHLAFINGTDAFYTKPDVILDVATRGISNIIEGCIANNIKTLSVASSSEVYQTALVVPTDETVPLSIPDPLNPRYSYAGGKLISELMTINFGRKYFDRVTIFRPHNIYGPDMGNAHVIPQLIEKIHLLLNDGIDGPGTGWPIGYWPPAIKLPIQGSGKETRAFCYIDDAIAGILLVLDKGKHLNIYNIGTQEETAIKDLVRMIGKTFGREVEILPGKLQEGSTLRRCPDMNKLKALGFESKVPLDKGLMRCVYGKSRTGGKTAYKTDRSNYSDNADSGSKLVNEVSSSD